MAKGKNTKDLAEMTQEELLKIAQEQGSVIEAQSAKIEELEKKVNDLQDVVDEMGEDLDKMSKKKPKNSVVTVEKEQYEIVIQSFNFEGRIVTADDIQKDKELAKKLVSEGVGALKKVK